MLQGTFSQISDEKSENILYLLSLDSRQSVSDIARTLRLKRWQVESRVNKLLDNGFMKYLTVNNAPPGLRVTILAEVRVLNEELLETLRTVPTLLKLKETLGMYSISILCDVSSHNEMNSVIKQVSDILHKNTLRFDVLVHDWEDALGHKSFCHMPRLLNDYSPIRPAQRKATEEEARVLELLKRDTCMSFRKLSEKADMDYKSLKSVMGALRKDGFLRCTVDPDYHKLGLQFHNMLVKIEPAAVEDFESYITTHPRVHWVKHSLGRWDYVLSIVSHSIYEFIDIIRQIRTDNADILLNDTALISKIQERRRY